MPGIRVFGRETNARGGSRAQLCRVAVMRRCGPVQRGTEPEFTAPHVGRGWRSSVVHPAMPMDSFGTRAQHSWIACHRAPRPNLVSTAHSSGSIFSSRRNLVPLSKRWHSLQSALLSSTTISATRSPHASQMTTLATSFGIGHFLARDFGACLRFSALRRPGSASGCPFSKENNYVCQKRTCDPKRSVLTRRRRWCVFTQLRLRPMCSASWIRTPTTAEARRPPEARIGLAGA